MSARLTWWQRRGLDAETAARYEEAARRIAAAGICVSPAAIAAAVARLTPVPTVDAEALWRAIERGHAGGEGEEGTHGT